MRQKCSGLLNLDRLRPVLVILQTKRKSHDRDLGLYIFGKGFPQATASLKTCYNAFEWSYPPKSNNKIIKLDWPSIDVRRPSIDVQPSNNVRTSNGGQPWPAKVWLILEVWQCTCVHQNPYNILMVLFWWIQQFELDIQFGDIITWSIL